MENKFIIKLYHLEEIEPYKKVTVNQDILVTNLMQIEAKELKPFNVCIDRGAFSLYLYFSNDEKQVNEQLKFLANWLNEKRCEQ